MNLHESRMLFDSTLRKELARTFSATLVILVTIVMTVMLIRTLGQASVGRVDPSEVMLVLGLTVLGHLPTILTLSLFVAVTATLTRMYAASEMVIWFSSGQGLMAFVRPLLRFAWPVLLTVAALALLVWPWTNQQIGELRDRYQGRGDIERVAPGRFVESAAGQRVFFIDKQASDESTGTNVFITTNEHERETVISARRGRVMNGDDQRELVLDQGFRMQINARTDEVQVSEFDEYESLISARTASNIREDSPRTQSSLALVRAGTPRHLGELSWRLGLALAAFNCMLIGLVVTRVNPRVGRSASLIFSLFAFATYYNLINAGQSWIERGLIGSVGFMLLLHGGVLLLAVAWLAWRERNWRFGRAMSVAEKRTGS